MYVLYICILASLLQIGLFLNPQEIDLNSLSSNYDTVDENPENFDPDIITVDQVTTDLLEIICKNSSSLIYISQEDVTINCKNFQNEPFEYELNRPRRSADEMEGSGNNEILTNESTTEEVTTKEVTTQETSSMKTVKMSEASKKTSPTTTERTTTRTTTVISSSSTITTEVEVPVILPEVEPPKTEEEPLEKTEEKKVGKVEEKQVQTEEKQMETTEESQTKDKQKEIPEQKQETTPSEENDTKNEEKKVDKENQSAENSHKKDLKKDAEVMKGRTLLNPKKSEENRVNNNDTEGEDPAQVKESTEETKKGASKDTTILVFLFVAVVVVGAAAFGYNFIKKRKRQAADLERVERNSIKRSLQNLTKPEGEPEKKPLIGDKKDVEMVDMKKVHSEEKNQDNNTSTDPVLKS